MNLPAVMLLLISFSTAYCIQCKLGTIQHSKDGKIVKDNTKIEECNDKMEEPFCQRIAAILDKDGNRRPTEYFCPDDKPTCGNGDGSCKFESSEKHARSFDALKCCSSDKDFKNIKDNDLEEVATTPSSAISSRALLAIITALLGSIF